MLFQLDERCALFFTIAPPVEVWSRLDGLSSARFYRLLTVKKGLARLSEEQLEHALQLYRRDLLLQELGRDSNRALLPGQRIEVSRLPWLPASLKMSCVLRMLNPRLRESILKTLQPDLAALLRQRIRQKWEFSPAARRQLLKRCRFDLELFESFARSAPGCVAEWLVERLYFGVEGICRLCELSPIPGDRLPSGELRRRACGPARSLDGRRQMAAIVLMSLPPEVSAHLFKHLGPEVIHAITLSIAELPPITPETRQEAIAEVTRLSPGELEIVARTATESIGQQMRQYLEGD